MEQEVSVHQHSINADRCGLPIREGNGNTSPFSAEDDLHITADVVLHLFHSRRCPPFHGMKMSSISRQKMPPCAAEVVLHFTAEDVLRFEAEDVPLAGHP